MAFTHPKIASLWHPAKNNGITAYDVMHGSKKKAWWKCPLADDHEYEAVIASVRDESFCPCCSGKQTVLSNCLAATHPNYAAQWHPTKNGILSPAKITCGSNKKVWWKCDFFSDHEWEDTPNCRISNNVGCPCCAGYRIVKSNCLLTIFPQIAAEWHPIKNGSLTPSDVGIGTRKYKKIWWRGRKCGHEWQAHIPDRVAGNCCPICNFSQGENAVKRYLDANNIRHEFQYRFASCKLKLMLPFDFVLADRNKIIEYHGIQHYQYVKFFHKDECGFNRMKFRDDKKKNWCSQNGIDLLVIPYWNKDKIDQILDVFLSKI